MYLCLSRLLALSYLWSSLEFTTIQTWPIWWQSGLFLHSCPILAGTAGARERGGQHAVELQGLCCSSRCFHEGSHAVWVTCRFAPLAYRVASIPGQARAVLPDPCQGASWVRCMQHGQHCLAEAGSAQPPVVRAVESRGVRTPSLLLPLFPLMCIKLLLVILKTEPL